MKVLVSVGTTAFDSLIRTVDQGEYESRYKFEFQVADGSYHPKNYPYFKFVDNIWEEYDDYFYIVHCGAGTVYKLLEEGKRFIAVANCERVDKHQLDLAGFLKRNNYSLVAETLDELDILLRNNVLADFTPESYVKNKFFVGEDLTAFVRANIDD